MASFLGLLMAVSLTMMAFMASSSLSLSSNKPKLETTITAAPALLPTTTTEISPDIAPLLPSSGGAVPSTGSSMPTIPSNPSQNPEGMPAFSPDSAVSPSGLLPESAAVSLRPLYLHVNMVLLSVLVFGV